MSTKKMPNEIYDKLTIITFKIWSFYFLSVKNNNKKIDTEVLFLSITLNLK